MIPLLNLLLRIAGAGLIILSLLHIPIGRQLKWNEDCARLTPANAAIFRVHNLFICVILVMMGLPCLFDPGVFLESSRAGAWISWSFAAFWGIRLYCQWFVYESALWRDKPLETFLHWWVTVVWTGLTALFTTCGLWQAGWRP